MILALQDQLFVAASVNFVSSFASAWRPVYHNNRDFDFMALDILKVAEVPHKLVSYPDQICLLMSSILRKDGGLYKCVYVYVYMCSFIIIFYVYIFFIFI